MLEISLIFQKHRRYVRLFLKVIVIRITHLYILDQIFYPDSRKQFFTVQNL